jgi:hypothetical protein
MRDVTTVFLSLEFGSLSPELGSLSVSLTG